MKPEVNLTTSLRYLKGVGPERSKVFARLELHTLRDLFYFFPRRYEDRSTVKTVSQMNGEDKECVRGTVMSRGIIRTKTGQSIFKAVISDGKAVCFATWFNQPYLTKVFSPKTEVVFYGKAEREGQRFHMVHPEYEILPQGGLEECIHSKRIVPVYPLTEDLSQKGLRAFIHRTLRDESCLIKDALPFSLKKRLTLSDEGFAMREIHFPKSFENLKLAYRRLVFDEFFALQLMIQRKRMENKKEDKAIQHLGGEEKIQAWIRSLEFELTRGQALAIEDLLRDMRKPEPMCRLVQGDVGSGKTAVAGAALLFTVMNGFQGALMAPTEVLAQQLYFNLSQLLEPWGVVCGYLSQEANAAEKEKTLCGVREGLISVVVGTHALIQESVQFKKLGLAVIDEQHKFGVFQRSSLKDKAGKPPHFLLMTATPIPRTLAMTLYGDLDVSVIAELPKGRKPVKTFWVGENKRADLCRFLESQLEKGGQAYLICPRVEDSGEISMKSVTGVYAELAGIFSHRKTAILHGRMKSDEKKKVMQDFKEKRIELLVATVVIEVGVDVPNANLMIIENAERFGLAQLHQLRGRVGRGSEESYCILFSETNEEEARERLEAFEKTRSGFEIAEKDLELRGAGEILGEKQHGLMKLRIGDLAKDIAILELAKKEAETLLQKDPQLKLPEHRALDFVIRKRFGLTVEKMAISV